MKTIIRTIIVISVSVSALASTNNTDQIPVYVSGDTTNGYGKIIWPNGHPDGMPEGTTYEGYFKENTPEGFGKLTLPNAEYIFLGEFKSGSQIGFGVALNKDGRVEYAGELETYEPSGKGFSQSEDGEISIFDIEKETQLTMLPSGKLKRSDIYGISPTADTNSVTGILIPNNLDECFVELKTMLSPEFVDEIKNGTEEDMSRFHHGFGMWMRNNWALWKGSELSKWFNKKGIHHPDDMSGIIFDSFWRHLNNQPLKLEEQIKYYQDYWAKANQENESNQKLQPTVKTPVESGKVQGTAAEL